MEKEKKGIPLSGGVPFSIFLGVAGVDPSFFFVSGCYNSPLNEGTEDASPPWGTEFLRWILLPLTAFFLLGKSRDKFLLVPLLAENKLSVRAVGAFLRALEIVD